MKTKLLSLIACMALLGASPASAASMTYDLTAITIGSLSLAGGMITTDGTIGTLASSNITAWSITITGGTPSPIDLMGTSPSASFLKSVSPLTATSTELLFDFSCSSCADGLEFLGAAPPSQASNTSQIQAQAPSTCRPLLSARFLPAKA